MTINPLDHEGLVRQIAKRYRGCGLDLADLRQEGQIGLLLACQRFDPTLDFEFSTFAYPYISGRILEAIKGSAWERRPRPLRVQHGETEARSQKRHWRLERFRDWAGDERHRQLKSEYLGSFDAERLHNVLLVLPERERTAVKLHFGIESREPMELRGVGSVLGVTRQRAWQILNHAIRRLKEQLTIEQMVA